MRVAILKSNAGARGGLELYSDQLARAFLKRGDEVTLLTTGQMEAPYQVLSLCNSSKFTLRHLRRFDALAQSWVARHKPDIIFGMERNSFQTHYRAGSGVHAVYLQKRQASPLKRLSFGINPLHKMLLNVERRAFEHPELKKLFVNSHMVKQEILERFSTDPEKVVVVHNGVEWSLCKAAKPNERCHFLFVGNDYRRKGLLFLLQALRGQKEYSLTVVGRDKNPSFFQKLAFDWKLNVFFAGPQPNLEPFYERADCLVLPTLYDPFANVTLEALARGLFVITSPNNGGKEVLTPESGIVVEPPGLAEALDRVGRQKRDPERIRATVQQLTFENQLHEIVRQC